LKERFPGLVHMFTCNSAAPLESDLDILVKTLVGSNINDPVIVNGKVGLSRATTGCVAACPLKEFQISVSFAGVNIGLLRMDSYTMDMNKEALFRGDFEVIKELIAVHKDDGAKSECDKVIDKNEPAETGGNGIKQLIENVTESKLGYEIKDDATKVFMNNIHKYF